MFFGITKDLVGRQQISIEIDEPMLVSDFKSLLLENYPKLTGLNAVAIAVNSEYAEDHVLIKAQDEVALIPPVSGG